MKTTYRRKTQVYTFEYFRNGTISAMYHVSSKFIQVDDALLSERFKSARTNKRQYVVIKQGYAGVGSEISEC